MFRRCLEVTDATLQTNIGGLPVNNPVGLAAGWDKSGYAASMLGHLGFGFAEIGSISADFSAGNPKPRLFRLPQDRAIVVYYGLPNDGAAVVASRLRAVGKCAVPLGLNLVKTNRGAGAPDESYEQTMDDYVRSFRELHGCADYLVLNLSCPNAKGGKDLFSEADKIGPLLARLQREDPHLPVFLKVIPTADPEFLDALVAQALPYAFVRGFIFNLPPGKPAWLQLATPKTIWEKMPGAVAGAPVAVTLNHCIRELYARMPRDRFQIIGVGGVFTAEDAYEKIKLGASAVQIYTAMIYEGPGVIRRINEGLRDLLRRDGFKNLREAVGTAHRASAA
jgi:dihydroorotate dehydrogenase (fumarate)/dihydroorotate dehydrogenase